MAIRYTPKYNAEIRRRVHNFNQTRKRAELAGVPKNRLPRPVKVSEIKARFPNRQELNRELARLDKFSRKSLKDILETGGAITTAWNLKYLKSHTEGAREHFKNRQKVLEQKIKNGFPGESLTLDNVKSKLDILNLNIEDLSDSELRSYSSIINEYIKYPNRSVRGYRGFLSEVDWIMGNVGVSEEKKKEFFDKFKKLTPDQFQYLYDNSDLITKIYLMVDSPTHIRSKSEKAKSKEPTLNTDTTDAETQINTLLEEVDLLVAEAEENA